MCSVCCGVFLCVCVVYCFWSCSFCLFWLCGCPLNQVIGVLFGAFFVYDVCFSGCIRCLFVCVFVCLFPKVAFVFFACVEVLFV